MNEVDYIRGSRTAWSIMLRKCLEQLGYKDPALAHHLWISEREESIQVLRGLCEHFGDNDWDETLNLADVIDKHLGKHLHATEPSPSQTASSEDHI